MIKTIRRKIGLNLFDIGLDNVSLDMRSKTQATKGKNQYNGPLEKENFSAPKSTIKQVKKIVWQLLNQRIITFTA